MLDGWPITREVFTSFLLSRPQKALKERGIDSMLDEAREENKENDAQNMRRNGMLLHVCCCTVSDHEYKKRMMMMMMMLTYTIDTPPLEHAAQHLL